MFNSVDLGKHESDPETGVGACGRGGLALVSAEISQHDFFAQKRCCVIAHLDRISARFPGVVDQVVC